MPFRSKEPENTVTVDARQLDALIKQNAELKADIGALVGVFKGFAGLFSGKGGVMTIIPVITRLISNKSEMEKISHIVPIIDKYTETNIDENAEK
jgi:hypothetical protein